MNIQVTCHRDPENLKIRYFRVKVQSRMKSAAATLRVYPGAEGMYSPADVKFAVGMAGGECAEYCCEHFGDGFEPQEYARAALVALARCCKGLANGTEPVYTGGHSQGYGPGYGPDAGPIEDD